MEHFAAGTTARCASSLVGINKSSSAYYFERLREIIAYQLEREAQEVFEGEIEVDESYFGGTRKGKRGRGAAGKVAVFGILKRGGKVYTKVVLDTKSKTLMPIITSKIAPDSVVYTDSYGSYNVLDVSLFYHERVSHSLMFAKGKNHINGVENFWNQVKRILRKYNGIDRNSFPLFLKECEFRFNRGSPKQLKILRV